MTLTPLTGACLRLYGTLYGTLYGSTSALYVGMVCYALPYSDARTAGRSDARAYGYMPWIDGATLGRSDARTHSGSLSHPMDSDGIGCARLRRSSSLSHTPAVYHACGWLWRAVAATILAAGVVDACAGCMLAAGSSIGYRRKRSRRSDAMRGLLPALHPAASVAASCSYRRSVGHLSAVWPVSGGLGMGQCLRPVAAPCRGSSLRAVGRLSCPAGGLCRGLSGILISALHPLCQGLFCGWSG